MKISEENVGGVYRRVVHTFHRGHAGQQFRKLFRFYRDEPGEEIKRKAEKKRKASRSNYRRGHELYTLRPVVSRWTIVTAAEKQQVPLRSSPSSAKLLIISVNEQTRPGSAVTRRATIPWRNALFIIYQKQSTGHFPLYFVHSSFSPVRREAFFPGLRPILILRRAFRTCFSEDRKQGRIIDREGLSSPRLCRRSARALTLTRVTRLEQEFCVIGGLQIIIIKNIPMVFVANKIFKLRIYSMVQNIFWCNFIILLLKIDLVLVLRLLEEYVELYKIFQNEYLLQI